MNINSRLQALLMAQLQKFGTVELVLPDGVVVELGITQIDQTGDMVKAEDYCWVIASRNDKSVSIDKYNVGVRFSDDPQAIVLDDRFIDNDGVEVRRLDVV